MSRETQETAENLWQNLYDLLQPVLSVLLAVVLVSAFGVRITRVDGESMRETLQDGDLLLTISDSLCGPCEAGEIVIVVRRDFRGGMPIVKRVVALEGQMVDIDFETGAVYVDGVLLEEPYIREPVWTEQELSYPLTVPEGCLFLMGDNRNNSLDSRSVELGPVDSRCVTGRAVFLALPGVTEDLGRREWSRLGRLN